MISSTKGALAALAVAASMAAASGASASVLYSNGPVDGTLNAWGIFGGQAVANTFTLSSAATVTGIDFGVWTNGGDTLQTVDWSINTAENDYSVDGTANVVQGALSSAINPYGYDVHLDSFSIGALNLGPGTYYLVLQNAVTADQSQAYWDINNGPSGAFINTSGGSVQDNLFPGSNSSSFDILSDGGGVPEPAAWALMIGGFGMAGAALRRRKVATAA